MRVKNTYLIITGLLIALVVMHFNGVEQAYVPIVALIGFISGMNFRKTAEDFDKQADASV